ncbi:titin isoform X8 [Rosa chinensis]|uniref:titin isoform X8 n=1 Tax=Rosa chinensis TaxID=74649 RepID=UPI000D08F392|nr:titin isoform X8 [Rosa chinensis]
MATEADVPEAICIAKGEGVDRSVPIEQLHRTVDQCSPVELNKSKGDLDQHPETHTDKPFADGENVQVEYSMKVESKNDSFGISEGEHFLDPLSEISQAGQSNQAGMEIPKNEAQLQKGTQVGEGVQETGTEENEVIEERQEKFEQDIEKHDIVNAAGIISEIAKTGDANLEVEEVEASTNETTVDQHVQVISNQQDSIKEDVQCLEKEAESSEVDTKGAEKAHGNAESYSKEASDLLEATTFQEYEASTSILDLTNSRLKKDMELETNVHNSSDTNPILQEEFEEGTSTKVTSNDEEDSQQTLQNYELKEELQKLPEVTPEDAKTESAMENAEVISCTEQERTMQSTPEYSEKEEANPVHCPKENATMTEEVFEAASTEQETAEHALPEIHTAENHPQEFNEEKSRDYQASVEAAYLSTHADEKNLEEQAIQEKSSSLVEEETTQQISREEEVHATNSKEEEKEADTKCEEPIEVADATREIEFETIEQRTETNKDLNVPIPEEEAYAEESTKAFVQNNSFLSEVSEVKTKEIIQEDQPTVGDYGLVSGELSQVSASKEAEAENEGHVNNTPEEMGLQTILTDETVVETEDHAQAGENLTSKEKIEKEIQTAEGEGERDLKEIKEENKEPVDNADIAPEEDLATILTDQPALQIEDIKLQAEESVDSKDKSEEQILTAADEGGNGLIEAQTENNEQVTDADIASEEKGLETILTDETALDIKDIDVQAEKDFRSKESSEKQVPVVADEGDTFLKEAEEEKEQEALPTILKGEPPLDIEVIDVQAEESFSPQEKLEELIPAVADEGDTGLKEAEEENKEQVKITDSAPEVKVTIGERALDNEDIELQVEENVSSKDNLEKQIPTTALEGDSGLKEPEEENELVKSIDISTEEKGPATILTDETTHNAEDTDVKASKYIKSKDIEGESCSTEPQEENKEKVTYIGITPEETILNSQEKLEEQVPEVAEEGDTGLNEAEEENKEQIKSKDTSPEEKGLQIISTDDTALDSVKIELQSEENVSSTDNLEKQIPTEEAERGLTEAEAENKEQATITDITPEVKSVPTTLTDQTALDSEKIELHAEEKVNSTDYLEKQIPTAADEGEDILTEAKAESKEQVTINDITPEEKGVATILTDERSLEIEDIDEQAEESSNSKENLEEEISAAPVLGETCVKEDEEESTEQVKSSNSSHEGKGLATILTEETTQDIEYTDVKAGADFNSGDILEKQIPTAVYEGETDSKEVEAENKEQVETTEIAPEEKGLATILIDETAEGIEVIDVQAGEINLKEVLEKQIPTAVDEGETDLKEAEADIKEQVETTDIVPEQKGVDTILSDERALDLEDVHVQEQENFNSNENLESQIPTTVGEGETDLNEGEAEIKEQVKCTETAVEEKDATTILRDETVVEVQDVDIKAEEKPIEAGEGEKKVGILDDIPVNVYNTELVEEVTVEQSYQVPSHEEAEPKIAVEDEKSEDHPERNHMIVEEPLLQVIDEPKITSRDFSEEQIIEGNVVSFTPESIEEDTVKSSQDNEKETIELKEEGSCTENAKDENASDLTREYIPEDAPKQIIDEQYNAVKSENKILEDSQTIEVDESSTCETKNIEKSEEIPSTLPVQYEEVQQGEESCTESTKEENASDHTREYVPEDATEQIKDEDCNTVESKNEVLEDSQIVEVDESTTCETKNLETTEEIPSTLPVKYDEVLQGEGSYTESPKEENASDLTREYVPEDATEQIKDEDCNAVKSKNEILEDSQTVEVDESTTCETKNLERSEEILSTLPVKYDEVQQGEGSSPAPAEPLKEEDTLSVLVAKDDDGDSGAVTNTETDAKVPPNDEEDSPEVLQKYEPEEEITELPHVKPEETTPESSSENAEVITCRKEEIQESLDKEKDTKESDTSSGEVLETTITEALPEIHTVEDTAERATEYQACIEAAELSTEGEKENSEEQTTREVSSSLIVETSEESSKEEEEKNEGQVECKDSIEEVISETLEDTTEPKPISEEESNKSLVQDNSFSLEASEKEIEKEIQGEYSSTVRSFDSKVVSDETGLTEATTEDKGQVKTTHISSEEKDNEGTDVHNTELVRETVVEPSFQVQTLEDEAAPKLEVEDETDKSDDLPEKNNKICEEEVHDGPKITDRDFNEEQITEANVANLTTEPVQEQEMVKDYQAEERETERLNEEGSSIENIKEGNASDISTECVPEDIDEKLKECIEEAVESKEQIIEAKAVSFTPESIEDDTVKNSQDSEKETIELKEEESCTESIKEENASELSPEYIQEDGSKNFKDDKEDALKSEEEILEDSQTVGVVESTTCETVNVERSEDILIALPAKYDEGSSPAPTEASKQENIDEDTSSVQETKDKDVEVTVTETSAEAPSNDEDDSPQVLQKYEPEEELTILRDAQPEEMKPEPSSEIEEVITCTKEETQESLDNENDTKESDASTGEACIEAAELSTEGEKEEQTTQEVSSSPIGEETTEESSKEEENKEAHEECKEVIEGASSFLSKASEKEIEKEIQGEYSSTVRSFDSEVASDERGLTEATEQVETTCIAPEEKDIEGTDVYNTELVGQMVEPSFQVQTLEEEATPKLEVEDETDKSDDLPEKNNKICEEVLDEPKITDRDFKEEQITEGIVANLTTVPIEEQEMVKDYQGKERETEKLNEEGSSIENIKEGSANDISTVCVPEDIDEKLKECIEEAAESKKQIIEGNVTSLTPESIEEDTVKNSQDSEKETIGIKEEGTCTESIKEENATELSPEYIQEDGSKKFNDDKEDALKSEEQILEDSQTVGVVESTTCETVNVERSEDTLIALPAKYDEGSSPAPTEASKQENIDEDTSSVQETKDKDGAVTVTETSAEAPSNDEDDSPQVLQKYEPEEELTILRDVPPEEMKPELSNEIEEVITCTKEETQESLDKEKDAKESDTSTGEACIEAAELSTEGEKEEQITQEVSSSLIGEETTEESSKEEEKKDAHEECKEAIEGDSSFLSNASEKEIEKEIQGEYSSTVRSFDSEVASDERGLTEATEQVETTHIALEEKDIGGKDVYNTELVGETVEPSSQVQTLEEKVETKLEVEDETDKSDDHPEKGDKICEEVRDEPKITDRDFNEEQITGGNVASCASGSVEEETVKDDQGDQKERDGSKEEGSSIENIKEGNASVISTESVPKDIVEERTGEAVESKQEILQESQKDDRDEETFPIKVAEDNDDYNSTVVLSEAGAEVTSIGEESSEVAQILELGEKHAQVETSDLADEIEVRDLEDKVSVAETTEEETKEVELSNLALEKLDSDAPEEETTESFEVVPEFDSKSTDVVAQDEVTADQTLDEEISKEPSTLPSEEKEVKASEAEHAKEAEVPTEEDRGDLLAARSAEETYLPKEEPRELRVSELALERLDAGETEEETKENSETVSKFDSQSIGVVSEDEIITDQTQCEGEKEEKTSELVQETLDADAPEEETKDGSAMVPKVDSESIDELVKEDIIADQTLPEGISTEQLQIPSTALLPKEKELEASEHEHETTSVDKNIEKDNLKEVEVPADEDKQELFAATPTETCLQTEEPRDSELALHKLDAGETEDEIKETFETVTKSDSQSIVVACGDEIVVDQTLCEGITDTPLSKERELGASELALEKLDAVNTEEIKENPEIVPKFDSGIIVVSSDEITIDQTLNEEIMKEQIQSPSSTLLPEEKEHETSEPEPETTAQDKSTEQECTKEVEMSADDNMQALLAARPVEEECLQKEEPSVLSVSEEANETFETVSRSDFPSIAADPKEEITADKTLSEGVTDVPIEISSYTPLHEEKEPKASELDLEKLDADTTEEEIKEGSEVIPQSVSQSSCEVSKDEIIADQLEVPSFALLPDENELKASEHEHETIIDDKNIEDENLKEVEEPTDEASQDVLAARSAEETCLHKEEPSGLKVPELAVEKLEADETEEVKQAFETVSKSGSQSINAVSQDDTIADQTLSDVLTDMPLDIPSDTSLPKENEEVKEAATKLALEKLDADAAEEVKKGSEVIPQSDLQSIDVVVKDEIIADQVLHECMTKEQLLIQSPTLLPEEKELKEIEHEHKNLEEESAQETEVTADEGMRDVFVASSEEKMHLQKEEPRELKVSELSPENVGEGEEEVTATFESTDAVSREQTIAEQTLDQNDEQLQIASPTLLPKEKEEATEQKEELEDCKVLELSPKGETEEETKETFETVPGVSSQSIGELATDEIVDQNPPSSKGCENITTINNAGEESMNVVETPNEEGRKDTNSAEETSIPIEEPRELNVSGLDPSSQYTERGSSNEVHEEEEIYIDSNEAKKNEASNEEKNLKVATSDSRAEDSSETTIEANQTAKIEVPNEELGGEISQIKEEKEVAKDSQLISVGEVNTRESQQENESRHEKYPEEKNDTFTAPSEYHHEVPEVDKTGSVSEDIEKQVKPDDKSSMDHSQYEAEGRIQETAIHLGLENQGDETNCENRTREVTYPVEKDSSVEAFQGVLGVEETDETTHNTKQLEKESDATDIPSSKDDALSFLQDPKLEDSTPSNDTLVARETKEENFCESGIETADPTSAQIPLSERLMDESTKERMKVVTHLTEEKEPTVGKELQADNEEEEEHENVEEAKTDEEKEDTEHKRAYQGYDEPVIVEASRDTEVKVKKSHNILSGMGSKVKHSISKVKKAIIGKSSNSKTQSEK